MTDSATQTKQRERAARVAARGECAEAGPYGYVCTDSPAHRYAHYDSHRDTSWTDRWHEDVDVDDLDEHPIDCPCDDHR